MKRNVFEIIVGSIVLVIAIVFGCFLYKEGNIKPIMNGYVITAEFQNADGISAGSDVKIAGVKVGSVVDYQLNVKNYTAAIKMQIANYIKVPSDSSIAVTSSGLIGGKFLSIMPGSEDDYLKNGSRITYTQSSVSIEDLIGKFAFSGPSSTNNKQGAASFK